MRLNVLAFSNDMHSKWRKESARRLAKSFNGQVGKIKKELFQLDNEVGYAHSELELASLEIARLNVRALLLVAEQLADIQDAIEDHTAYSKLGGANNANTKAIVNLEDCAQSLALDGSVRRPWLA